MNFGTERTRRWRKKGQRGVSPIIATILLVAITVVLAAVLYILISGLTKGPGNTPIGTAFTIGSIAESGTGPYVLATEVQTATSGMTWSNMIFQVQSVSGTPVALGATGTMTVTNAANSCNVAVYTFTTATWAAAAGASACSGVTLGGPAQTLTGDGMTLSSTNNLANAGNTLVIVGQGSYSGTASFSIP